MSTVEWFDDLVVGTRCQSEEVQITETDIKRFAIEFDPQPMHLDEAAAAKTVFKGLAASGWHTAAIAMSLATKARPRPLGPHPLIGIGVDELRWLMPVRPGDVLHLEGEIVSLARSMTKPQHGADNLSTGRNHGWLPQSRSRSLSYQRLTRWPSAPRMPPPSTARVF